MLTMLFHFLETCGWIIKCPTTLILIVSCNMLNFNNYSNYSSLKIIIMKKIWGLKVPEKVRNLVWRACRNALPTKMNLLHRKVVTSAVCELCNLHTEDPAHALYHCPKPETLWQSTPLWGHSTIKQCSSF